MNNPQESSDFGNGEVGGDNCWSPPVHGTTTDGRAVTVSFGKEGREGHTGIASGHVSGAQFYGPNGHDHYGPEGQSHADRKVYYAD